MHNRLFVYVSFALMFALVGMSNIYAQTPTAASPDQVKEAVEASKKKRGRTTFWRSEALAVSFGYDERWVQVPASQKNSAVVISWRSRTSGGLMATCYLETSRSSELANLSPNQVEQRADAIAQALLRRTRLSDPNARLVKWRPAKQDNHPVVYSERDVSVENIDGKTRLRLYSLTSAWNGTEVNFECGSSIPRDMPQASGVVEFPIQAILGSLQFTRGG